MAQSEMAQPDSLWQQEIGPIARVNSELFGIDLRSLAAFRISLARARSSTRAIRVRNSQDGSTAAVDAATACSASERPPFLAPTANPTMHATSATATRPTGRLKKLDIL